MRIFLFTLVVLSTAGASFAVAASSDKPPAPTSPACCAVEVSASLPEFDQEHGIYKDVDAQVPGAEAAPAATASTNTSASVTVTATVLPSRSVVVAEDGSMTVMGNTKGPSWWSFQDADQTKIPVDRNLWERARSCMATARAYTGTLCHLP